MIMYIKRSLKKRIYARLERDAHAYFQLIIGVDLILTH
jgi:hypothetical protein